MIEKPMVDLTYHKQFIDIPTGKSNIVEHTLDSLGSSRRTLTQVEARIRETVLSKRLDIANAQSKEPGKRYYIEEVECFEGSYPRVYDIQPDGSHIYNPSLSRYLLENAHNSFITTRILRQAIIA